MTRAPAVNRAVLIAAVVPFAVVLGACSSAATSSTTDAAQQRPHAKKVEPIPDCTTLAHQQDYAAALGRPVTGAAAADDGTDSCRYPVTGGFIGVTVTPTQPPARTATPTTFDGNKASTTTTQSVGAATSCALHITLNPANPMVLTVNTQTSDKSVDACAVSKKLAGVVFDRIPDA